VVTTKNGVRRFKLYSIFFLVIIADITISPNSSMILFGCTQRYPQLNSQREERLSMLIIFAHNASTSVALETRANPLDTICSFMLTGLPGWYKATTSLHSLRQNTLDETSSPGSILKQSSSIQTIIIV
jgi:hypothetical protein